MITWPVNAWDDNEKIPFLSLVFSGVAPDQTCNLYTEFDDEFDDIDTPLGQCTVLYNFEGTFGSDTCSARPETRFCSCRLRFYFLQATARAPYPSQRGSCWASWRTTKEMDGWGSWEAAVKRALYLHLMSVATVKTVCRAFLSKSQRAARDQTINHSARDSRRLTGTISIAWS